MDRLIFQQIDFEFAAKIVKGWRWKPLSAEQKAEQRKPKHPRHRSSYRAHIRNKRDHISRCNPSPLRKGYRGQIELNRSKHWKYAETYYDARDLSQSNREVV